MCVDLVSHYDCKGALTKQALFANNLPSIDLNLLFIASHDHCACSILIANTLYVRYLLANGRTALHKNFCIVFLSILVACSKHMFHHSFKSYVVISVWHYDIWKVLISGTSNVPIYISSLLTSTVVSFVSFIEAIFLLILFSSKSQYSSSSYSYG